MTAFETWAEHVQAVHREAAGVASLVVVQPNEVAGLIGDALAGDAEAGRLAKAITQAAAGIQATAGTRSPMLCSSCPDPLRLGRMAFAVVVPRRDNPTNLLAFGVCRRCATARADVRRKATAALRRIWPDIRAITLHPTAGQA